LFGRHGRTRSGNQVSREAAAERQLLRLERDHRRRGSYSVDGASIDWATLRVDDPHGDLTFIKNVTCEAVRDEERTKVAHGEDFPPEEPEVGLDVDYKDDIRSFFKESTIRLEWTGSADTNGIPEEGYVVWVRVQVSVD